MTKIDSREFGRTKDGQKVTAFEMSSGGGMRVRILDLGATVQSITVPDRDGELRDVVLGYDNPVSYENGTCYYGAVVGRCANRIGNARFVLDGREYQLEKSPGESNHVHGVFYKKMFEASTEDEALVLRYFSPDMEEGFPGNLSLEVRYSLTEDNALEISYKAETDAPTVLNLTNHTYFNLDGQDGSTIFDHKVRLNSSRFTEYAGSFAQTGNIISVDNTPLDFRKEQSIRARFDDDYPQLRLCTGYDHNMILDGIEGELKPAGTARSEKSGIFVEAFTTEPAIHFYSGNYMHFDPVPYGKNGVRYPKNGGLCFEAQHYPDSVNHPGFPSTVLRPGETYRQKTIYRFKTER
ncbi:MAG: galactose mutarotase [Lachnospiraceae bacterium]|nr:galactose mutarotase [Lachnospiraceae bacterium]